jgi:hypothetical protein
MNRNDPPMRRGGASAPPLPCSMASSMDGDRVTLSYPDAPCFTTFLIMANGPSADKRCTVPQREVRVDQEPAMPPALPRFLAPMLRASPRFQGGR